MRISELKVGEKAKIVAIEARHTPYRQRLIAMGLLPGTPFTVTRIAPLGDPIEIQVRGCMLSLRKSEANILQVQEVTP